MRQGQSFAYDVALNWTHAGQQHRLTGQPFYQVHHVKTNEAVMMVIGRLRYESLEDGKWKRNPANDYWFGTDLSLDEHGQERSGMPGRGGDICPDSVPSLMVNQMFPRIPRTDTDSFNTGETTKTMELTYGGFGKTRGRSYRGQSDRRTQARPIGGGKVQLVTRNKYASEDKSVLSSYQAQATFDNNRGLLLDKQVISQEFDSGRKYEVTVQSSLIRDPQALEAAKAQASQDYAELPAKMMPIRFLRNRIKTVHLPQYYSMDNLPQQGTVVAYYDGKYEEWYAVQFMKVVDDHDVRIRFIGSGEIIEVHVSTMANPKRDQTARARR